MRPVLFHVAVAVAVTFAAAACGGSSNRSARGAVTAPASAPDPQPTPAARPAPVQSSEPTGGYLHNQNDGAPADQPSVTTCQQIADKVVALIKADTHINLRANNATPEEHALVAEKLEEQVPLIISNLMETCANEQWPEVDRQCVMASTSIAEAEKCGS